MGLVKGAGAVLGMPSDVWHMLDRGYQYALTKGAEKMGLLTPEQGETLRQPMPGEEYGAGSDAINRHLMNVAKSAGADTSEPTTRAGEATEGVASFLPGSVAMGAESLGQIPRALVRYGLVPGAASEAAGQATKGTALEPYARVAGAIAPEGLMQVGSAIGRAASPMKGLLGTATDQDLTEAQRLLDESRAAGAPLTSAEAVQQATGNGTRATDLQRVVEQSPKGAAIMRPFMAERPAQTEALGRSTFDQIAPAADPYEVAPRIQNAADQTVQAANTARTQAVDPFYKAAATDRVPAQDMEDFLSKIDTMIAKDKTGILTPELSDLRNRLTETPAVPATPAQRIPTKTPTGATIWSTTPGTPGTPRVPVTDIENLDTARKYFRDRLEMPQWSQDATTKAAQSQMTGLLGDLRQKMIGASPGFAAGKSLYQDITENQFNPLTRSPTGQLAVANTYPKQAAVLFNPNPLPGSEVGVGKAVRDVAQTDPDAAAQLVRMHLERTFNEATQNNLPGANQFGAPKFAAVIAGNSQQAKNLEAAVTALPDGATKWAALQKGLRIMEGMGTRQPVGSQTAFNAMIQQELKGGTPVGEILSNAASPGRWTSLVNRAYQDFRYGRNTQELARIFTEGNIDDLKAISRAPGTKTFQAQAAMIGLLARQGALSNPGTGQDQRSGYAP
jgi:hypothetical protein